MKKKRFTEEQIAYALAQESTGQTIAEICRKLGVSEQTFYRWKKKFGAMGVAEVRRLKQLEDENAKLKRLVADLPPEDDPSAMRVPPALGLHPDLMPLELRGIRAISGLHSSDRVQRTPWGSACPGRCVDERHCNRSATKSRFPRRLRAIRRRARSGTPRAALH